MLRMLRLGVPTDYVGYTRGAGWLRDVRLQPARVFIVEGLFLDSVSAGASLSYDLLTAIEAPWQYIADLRRQRDAELRLQYESSYRSSLQTEKVIAHTRTAYIQYVRSHETIRRVMLKLDSRGLLESARTY
jgi:hypothetical protein